MVDIRETEPMACDSLEPLLEPRASQTLVCDPVCAQPFGHNVVGLKYFAQQFERVSERVSAVAARELPHAVAAEFGFHQAFDFYYHRHIRLPTTTPEDLVPLHAPEGGYADLMEARATRDFSALLSRSRITSDDLVVLPCVDLYGALGLLNAVEHLPVAERPKLLLRFIGVLEGGSASPNTGFDALLFRIRQLLGQGARIGLSAETPRYAGYLAARLHHDVHVVPYPVHSEPYPERARQNTFNVVLPGSARLDKGFLLMQGIVADVRRLDPDVAIRFTLQNLPPYDAINHSRYVNQLGALPGVALLASSLSEREMNQMYADADLVLIPYDAEVYRLRGSAVLMEAISRARPVLALDGPAFCDQIRYYGCGEVVGNPVQMTQAIVEAARHRNPLQRPALLQARRRFMRDSDHAFNDWIHA